MDIDSEVSEGRHRLKALLNGSIVTSVVTRYCLTVECK